MASHQEQVRTVRFAVVGQGHFAQTAILPAFESIESCKLTALFSGDTDKLAELKQKYGVEHTLGYDDYDAFLSSGGVDAVYLALPNHQHRDFTVRAAAAHVNVLCEKPMAVTSEECRAMIAACEDARVKLMIAYRLHFDEANMSIVDILASGRLGEPRFFLSGFSQQVTKGIRTDAKKGGGPIFDIGVYCINAARYLFGAEPAEVMGISARKMDDDRFRDVEEQVSVVMRFPNEGLANFTCAFGGADEGFYDVVCTEGRVRLDPAYEYAADLRGEVTPKEGNTEVHKFPKRDQIAAEIAYFADCVVHDRPPEPSGREGLADVRVIEAIQESLRNHATVTVHVDDPGLRPSGGQAQRYPAHEKPETVKTHAPTR